MAEFIPLSTATVVDVADNVTTVSSIPSVLTGIYVNTVLSAQALPIEDGTTAKITLPASLAAGTYLEFPDVKFGTSLVVDPDDSATGNITVFWRGL
jgi:hypothetical protein